MRNLTESFVSEVILSPTLNPNQSDGDTEMFGLYFGYMTFGQEEYIIDGMDTPDQFLGMTVTATMNSDGIIDFNILEEMFIREQSDDPTAPGYDWKAEAINLAQTWFNTLLQDYHDFLGED